MKLMIAEIYDAFIAAGTDEKKSRAAAEAVADYQEQINNIKTSIYDIRGLLKSLDWKLNFILAFLVALLLKIFL